MKGGTTAGMGRLEQHKSRNEDRQGTTNTPNLPLPLTPLPHIPNSTPVDESSDAPLHAASAPSALGSRQSRSQCRRHVFAPAPTLCHRLGRSNSGSVSLGGGGVINPGRASLLLLPLLILLLLSFYLPPAPAVEATIRAEPVLRAG